VGLVPASEYTDDDLISTVRVIAPMWYSMLEPLGEKWLAVPELVAASNQQQAALDDLATRLELPVELMRIDLTGEHELSLATALMRKRRSADQRAALEQTVDRSMSLLHSASEIVRAHRNPLTGPLEGSVTGLFISGGGVPKRSVDQVTVGQRGVEGDTQASRNHHGRAWQALCLWSGEVVDALIAEGHPIYPGAAGENVAVRGLAWADVLPGTLLQIGSVTAEVSCYTLPCSQNAQWFSDRDFERIHHRSPGHRSRLYASVIEPGSISVGDVVRYA
jgi:MOSC domain